ncbi:3-keto-disaccharide hydrolase [Algoriphagus machipongonensis]|uniref:Probable secreted glycosyl hydrolase n=1 Tax=Algoriphagus machipongonensis TaxID=388413 RepID=A3I2B6_9BACT|nr:DUF1080 domain-containing protein [Algoriphagus machipongonensis]EAZ79520.1 probable secreted glycosyl hydrolase [Algoriphagus machipongonensis]
MKNLFSLLACFLISLSLSAQSGEWVELFNGQNFEGWKISENPDSFSIEDGMLKVNGPRGHMFYEGEVGDHDFNNFELEVTLKTLPEANSGIFIHTKYQERGWPNIGHEIQVNQSHGDWRKTGSVYSFKDVRDTFVEDGEWYKETIIVQGDKVTVKVNGEVINEYDETKDREGDLGTKKLDHGTIALQAHDPNSVVYYKSVKIKILPD